MSGTIWLIAESRNDGEIARTIIRRKYPHVRVAVTMAPGKNPNISRLAQHIEGLIKQAMKRRKRGDCIAVLHDADLQTRSNEEDRKDYDRIREVCESEEYRRHVVLVIAHDEIEAWLLADFGLCQWLNTRPRNWDEQRQPSETLKSLLDKANKPKYREENLPGILTHLDGTADQHSPSLQAALRHLDDAPCVRQE
jgi:hypothetical protein